MPVIPTNGYQVQEVSTSNGQTYTDCHTEACYDSTFESFLGEFMPVLDSVALDPSYSDVSGMSTDELAQIQLSMDGNDFFSVYDRLNKITDKPGDELLSASEGCVDPPDSYGRNSGSGEYLDFLRNFLLEDLDVGAEDYRCSDVQEDIVGLKNAIDINKDKLTCSVSIESAQCTVESAGARITRKPDTLQGTEIGCIESPRPHQQVPCGEDSNPLQLKRRRAVFKVGSEHEGKGVPSSSMVDGYVEVTGSRALRNSGLDSSLSGDAEMQGMSWRSANKVARCAQDKLGTQSQDEVIDKQSEDGSGDDSSAVKRQKRLLRNRESASQSRIRRKSYISDLEGKCSFLEGQIRSLQQMANMQVMENTYLKQELSRVQQYHVMPVVNELKRSAPQKAKSPCGTDGKSDSVAEPAVLESDSLPSEFLPQHRSCLFLLVLFVLCLTFLSQLATGLGFVFLCLHLVQSKALYDSSRTSFFWQHILVRIIFLEWIGLNDQSVQTSIPFVQFLWSKKDAFKRGKKGKKRFTFLSELSRLLDFRLHILE